MFLIVPLHLGPGLPDTPHHGLLQCVGHWRRGWRKSFSELVDWERQWRGAIPLLWSSRETKFLRHDQRWNQAANHKICSVELHLWTRLRPCLSPTWQEQSKRSSLHYHFLWLFLQWLGAGQGVDRFLDRWTCLCKSMLNTTIPTVMGMPDLPSQCHQWRWSLGRLESLPQRQKQNGNSLVPCWEYKCSRILQETCPFQ